LIILNPAPPSLAEDLIETDKALKKIFKEATGFEIRRSTLLPGQIETIEKKAGINFGESHSDTVQLHIAIKDGQTIGFAFEDIVIGKWGPIHYLVGLDPTGTVLEVIVLDYQEIRGRPVAKKRFLRQYKKKNKEDPVRLRRDIDGVTGATISSRSLTDGVRKFLFIFEALDIGRHNKQE